MAGGRKRKARGEGLAGADMDTPKVNSAFSSSAVHRVFYNCGGEKLELLESIGFGGLTTVRKNSKLNRQLALWLLRSMDSSTASVLFGDGSMKEIKDADVNLILGLPAGDRVVSFPPFSKHKYDKVTEMLFLQPGSEIKLQYLEDILTTKYDYPMSEADKVAYRIAAVLFADAHFLAPKGNQPKINKQLTQLLCEPDSISSFNWCGYLIEGLKSSSLRVQYSIERGNKTFTLDGCLLLIEIFYLDNLDFGSRLLPYMSIPRAIDFTNERFKCYVDADKIDGNSSTFGRTKMKDRRDVLYSWCGKHWTTVPLQPLNRHAFFRGTTVQYISTLLGDNKGSSGPSMDTLSAYLANRIRLVQNGQVKDMSGPVGYSTRPTTGSTTVLDDPDLTGPNLILNYEFEIVAKEVTTFGEFGPSPFELFWDFAHPTIDKVRAISSRVSIMSEEEKEKIWYLHDVPGTLFIKGKVLYNQQALGHDLQWNFIDAALRMFTMSEFKNSRAGFRMRWRHFLPSFWAIDAKRGGELNQSHRIRDMFIGEHFCYNVENCRMIIAPVLVDCIWCCYVWDFKDKCITVLDPTRMESSPTEIAEAHHQSIWTLHDALFDCKNTFFRGWNVSRHDWDLKCKTFPGFGGPSSLSGVYALHYACFYDGNRLIRKLSEPDAIVFRDQVMYEVLTMQGNIGEVPLLGEKATRARG